jgi:heptosyltransferase III
MSVSRILVVRSGAVGDCVLTAPVCEALSTRYPGTGIDVLGNPSNLLPLAASGLIQRVIPIDRSNITCMFSTSPNLPASASEIFDPYDLALSYLPDLDHIFRTNLLKSGVHRVLIGNARPLDSQRLHMTHVLMTALKPIGFCSNASVPNLNLPSIDDFELRPGQTNVPLNSGQPVVAIHPGCGGDRKKWPICNWVELIDELRGSGIVPVITAGPADSETMTELNRSMNTSMPVVVDNLPLDHLAAVLGRCDGYVGGDTGITHLAAALGVPALALFGPTDPAVWGPRGRTVRILWGGHQVDGDIGLESAELPPAGRYEMGEITVERVATSLQTIMQSA